MASIIGLLNEALASKSTPKIIHFGDRVLLLERTESILCCVISDSDSMVLRSALKDFAREFEHEFKDALKDWQGLVDVFQSAYKLVVEDFSFILRGEDSVITDEREASS